MPRNLLADHPPFRNLTAEQLAALRGQLRRGNWAHTRKAMQESKLVVVIRRGLVKKDGTPISRAKFAVQVAHAVCQWSNRQLRTVNPDTTPPEQDWVEHDIEKKILLWADDEDHLRRLKAAAEEKGLKAFLVTDLGLTEFAGPTVTCLAIGPDWAEKINEVTGQLALVRD